MSVPAQNLRNLELLSQASQDDRYQMAFPALTNKKQPIDFYNRGLRDLFFLFQDQWTAETDWDFLQIHDLAQQANQITAPPHDLSSAQWDDLVSKIQEADQETYDSFAELQDHFTHKTQPPTDPQKFLDWFYYYLPYLTLELESYEKGEERLKWFMQQLPDDSVQEPLEHFAQRKLLQWYIQSGQTTSGISSD